MMTTDTQQKKKPVSLNYISGGIFLATAVVSIVQQQYIETVVWLTIGVAMVLANMHYLPKGADINDIPATPKWRKILSIVLLTIGMAAFGYIIGRDVKAKVERNSATSVEMPAKNG